MKKYAKAILAIVIAAGGALFTAVSTGGGTFSSVDGKHWLVAAIAVLGSGGVTWLCANGPDHQYIKSVVAFLSAGFGAAVIALNDNHITQPEWITIAMASVVALAGVFQISNGLNFNRGQVAP
jgi:hypothetical protein